MGTTWSLLRPPPPPFTEKHVPNLDGRVFIVTGGNAGIGLELVRMLHAKGGCTIYIASRSKSRIDAAIKDLESSANKVPPGTKPTQLRSLVVDFNDLSTVSSAVRSFLAAETHLDVLWNNAGVAQQPHKATTIQGHEIHMGINCLGPYLFTKLLTPLIIQTAQSAPPNSVRVIFTGSQIIDTNGPKGGVDLAEQSPGNWPLDKHHVYAASKTGNWFLSSELDRRVRKHGVVSFTQNPGNLVTKAWDPVPWFNKLMLWPFLYRPEMGAYTELWAGLSPDITVDDGGKFAVPWGGRWHPAPKEEIVLGLKSREEGGTGRAAEFWDWCDKLTRDFE